VSEFVYLQAVESGSLDCGAPFSPSEIRVPQWSTPGRCEQESLCLRSDPVQIVFESVTEDALATLLDTQAATLGTLQPSEQTDLADLLRTLLKGLGDIPAFRPTIAVQRRQS
jgi:hypothetical protein